TEQVHQPKRGDDVVAVVQGRVPDRLADQRRGGEVDDGLDAVRHQRVVQPGDVEQVADQQPIARYSSPVADGQVVVDPHVVAGSEQAPHGVAANIAGSAGDEDTHRLVGDSLGDVEKDMLQVDVLLLERLEPQPVLQEQINQETGVGDTVV